MTVRSSEEKGKFTSSTKRTRGLSKGKGDFVGLSLNYENINIVDIKKYG